MWIIILGVFFQVCWLFLWCTMCFGYLYTFYYDTQNNPNGWIIFAMILSLYWGLCVNNNIIRVTSCGVAGTWYFSASINYKPTLPALKRTIWTSFGSICLGSIVVPIIEGVRVIVTSLARDSDSNTLCVYISAIYNVSCFY